MQHKNKHERRDVSMGVWLWFIISIPVVLWDASFILVRPRSLPGGDLFFLWEPYTIYCKADGRYKDMTNDWVAAQSIGNLMEVAVVIFAVLFLKGKHLQLALFSSALMTFWKTVLYFTVEICSGYKYTSGNTLEDFLVLFVLPSSFWIIFPLYVMISTGIDLFREKQKKSLINKIIRDVY